MRDEYRTGGRPTIDLGAVDRIFQSVSTTIKSELLPYFLNDASSGEISVISCVMQTPGSCGVIDEQFGRTVCETVGVDCTGTIGIVKRMVAEGVLDHGSLGPIRQKLKRSGFYLTDQLLNELK